MADFTIDEAMTRIKGLLPRVAHEAVTIMQEEVPVYSGHMKGTVRILEQSENSIVVGTDVDYAYYVQHGRGEVTPKRKKALRWVTLSGEEVFSKRSAPAKANDFIGRTKARLEATHFDL